MTQIEQTSSRKFAINFGARRVTGLGVSHLHSSPSLCSSSPKSKDGRGDVDLRAFISSNSFFDANVYRRNNQVDMEFAVPSLLPWGEEQDEGVQCLRGVHMTEQAQTSGRKFTIRFPFAVIPGQARDLVLAANYEVPALRRKSGLAGMTKREVALHS